MSRQQLLDAVREVVPAESMEYVQRLNDMRFRRQASTDQLFFSPPDLATLLLKAAKHRGGLHGDDRDLMIAEGNAEESFELPDTYRYLKVPAEGRVGLLPIDELPHWVPVTLRAEPEPHTRIGFRRAAARDAGLHLVFTIDADFQRLANYATIILAPNWHQDPTTDMAVLDAFLGAPVPARLQSISVEDPLVAEHSWEDGSTVTVQNLRSVLPHRPLWLACRNRNLPGT